MPTGVGSLSEDRSAKAIKKVKYFKKKKKVKSSHLFHFIFHSYNLINTSKIALG